MKRRYLKKWVVVVLTMILLLSLIVLGGETETHFISSKIFAMILFLSNGYILLKYTKFED